jgi:glycosyltransferase involved in cell wall biosynthesis
VKIGIHMYFRPGFGGGERYLLTAAEALRTLGDVEFVTPAAVDLAVFERRFGLDLAGVRAVTRPRRRFHGLRDWLAPRPYDFFFALDNHLAPVQSSLGRCGVLHLQTPPYPDPAGHPLRARVKLRTYDLVACNSQYTRLWALRHGTAGLPVRVVHPPVDVDLYPPRVKRPIIVSVGRFFVGRHEKRHTLMIDAFRECLRRGLEGWELHLAGSVRADLPPDVTYLEHLRSRAGDLPVRFHVGASLAEMQQLYGEASLYWHAAGYGADPDRQPQHFEHFGMAIVEAMAAGAVPIVFSGGGPLEIVADGETGMFWSEPDELVDRTLEAARGAAEPLRMRARVSAGRFGKPRFVDTVRALARELLEA